MDTPSQGSEYENDVLKFIQTAVEEGDAFLRSQVGYDKITEVIDAIFNKSSDLRSDKLSSTTANYLGKIVLDLAAGMTDVRPFWEYRTANHRFDHQVDIYGRLSEHWWLQRQADMRFVDAIKYICAAGTAFLHLTWNPDLQDLQLLVEDPRDVIPIRPTSTMQLQDCMGVTIRRDHTVNYLRNLYPAADPSKIRAERDGSLTAQLSNTRYGKLLERIGSPFHSWMQSNRIALQMPRIPTCTCYTTYLKDTSVNTTSKPMFMGEWHLGPSKKKGMLRRMFGGAEDEEHGRCEMCERGEFPHSRNNWSYVVRPGERIYPNGRHIVSTAYGVLYDGPSIYWHGCVIPFPLVKLTLDPFPWSWLGKAVGWDLLPLQRSVNKAVQVWDDWLAKLARPDIIADKNSVSKSDLDKLDSRMAGLKIRQNPLAGKGIVIQPPPNMPSDFWKGLDFLINAMNELSGVVNVQALMRLNQMPSSDTIEQVAEKMSPSVRLRSKVLEAAIREFATMLAYDFTQFYTLPMRLTILGERGIVKEDFDFDPNTLIPDFVHAKDFDTLGQPTVSAMGRGPLPRYERAREVLRFLEFHIAPGSLLAASDMMEQMKYLQLYRMMALDIWSLAEKLRIPNFGEPPAGTVIERMKIQAEMGLMPSVSPVGRKASGQEPAKMKSS
jgi:hypothetical protein